MPVPWLTLIDTLVDVTNLALSRKTAKPAQKLEVPGGETAALGPLETRLTGVMVAALKEAFDRDAHRLDLERQQVERERVQAERMLKLELLRQAGEREIGRLRLMAGVAVASWIGTLLFSAGPVGGAIAARVMLGGGWLLLLSAMALSFASQSRVSRALATIDEAGMRPDDLTVGSSGPAIPWLIALGLAVIGLAVLIA